ncbi:NADH dehydrogenase [ubiquinone] 1 beta subcomplex subunit 4, partial [Anas platyrhynchos]
MAAGPPPSAAKGYGPNQFVSLPAELDPADYDASPEKRPQLKRQYQLQLNSPNPPTVIEDPALLRWVHAKTLNVYPTFRPTRQTSFRGALFAIGPILFWMAAFKIERVS